MDPTAEARARQVWHQLGEAIKSLFGFEGDIEGRPLENLLATGDDERIDKFIRHVEALIMDIKATI